MKTAIASVTFLIFGAGAAAVGALDNVALKGSDTLEHVTNDVLDACPAAEALGITYIGTGSTAGENAMAATPATQTVAPMSRFINAASTSRPAICAHGGTAEGLAIALDGLAVVANATTSSACGGGLAYSTSRTFPVTVGGDPAGAPVTDCLGCDVGTNTYRIKDWKDVLALVYGGQNHLSTGVVCGPVTCSSSEVCVSGSCVPAIPNRIDCAGDVRRSLVRSFGNLFESACSGGTCDGGLKRALRRADLSGTTDTFLSLVGLASMPPASTVPGATAARIAFCNAHGAGNLFGGQSDFLDSDPIRVPCDPNEQVCGRTPETGGSSGLGLVTVVEVPGNQTNAMNYPTTLCGLGTFRLLSPAPTGVTVCPNGKPRLFAKCFQPTIEFPDGTFTSQCLARTTPTQGFQRNSMDGRAYNLNVRGANGTYVIDSANRRVTGAFFRMHTTRQIAPAPATTCQNDSATDQLGCLAAANPCALAFAGREATTNPGSDGVAVRGLEPTQANIEALVTTPGTADDYPLARKLYFNSLVGFENITGGELELAKCMSNNAILPAIVTGRGFIALPGGVACENYDERNCTSPPGGVNSDACPNNPAGIAPN